MSTVWQNTLEELEEYISKNKSIEIDSTAVCLPDEVRPEFYRLFDKASADFVKDIFPKYIEDAKDLSRNYLAVKNRVCSRLGVQDIQLNAKLSWLIRDPVNGLSRFLVDPLFDVLKHKISLVEFENLASAKVKDLYYQLYREGYNRWVALALIEKLLSDEAFVVPVADQTTEPELNDASLIPGMNQAILPAAERAQVLFFDSTSYPALLVPNAIVHSTRANCFVSIRTDYQLVYRRAHSLTGEFKLARMADIWKHYGKENLWPDLGIYLNSVLANLTFIADYNNIVMPGLNIECMEKEDWYERGYVESILRHYYTVRPCLGSYIVCRESPPDEVMEALVPPPPVQTTDTFAVDEIKADLAPVELKAEHSNLKPLPDGVHLLVVGFDLDKLEPVVAAIVRACS